MEDRKLTEKEEAFCQLYVMHCNASKAARLAGYSVDTAYSIGWENLRKPELKNRIAAIKADLGINYDHLRERMIAELTAIAFADLSGIYDDFGELKPVHDWPEDIRAAVSSVESDELFDWVREGNRMTKEKIGVVRKVKRSEKVKAMELLSKMQGYDSVKKISLTDPDGNALQQPIISINVIQPPTDPEKIE